jgi:DNA-binding transcriptional MerR regulator
MAPTASRRTGDAPTSDAAATGAATAAATAAAADAPGRRCTITELAAEFDITPRAIRFYEDMALLHPARRGRNRIYSQRDRTRLKLTLRGKRLGLSLQEIRQLLDMYETPADTAPQLQAFLAVLAAHRDQLQRQREDLDLTLAEIEQHAQRCQALLQVHAASSSVAPARPRRAAARRA